MNINHPLSLVRSYMASFKTCDNTQGFINLYASFEDFRHGVILIMNVDLAPDVYSNLQLAYGNNIAQFISDLHMSCLFRFRVKHKALYSGCISRYEGVHLLLPSMFMKWGEFTPSAELQARKTNLISFVTARLICMATDTPSNFLTAKSVVTVALGGP